LSKSPLLTFIYGSLIAFVWEIYQMPLFEGGTLTPYQQTIRCGVASLGDGLILLAGYGLASLSAGVEWPRRATRTPYVIYFGFGLAVAVLVEVMATSLPLSSPLSWRYSELMPVLPVVGLAVVPLAMWTIVPALTLGMLRLGAGPAR
jgi:hypothetical protein